MNDNAGRSQGQDWRKQAANLRLQALLWETSAQAAETGYDHLGAVGLDFGQRVALRLRECAREAAWAATQIDVWADEEPCVEDVGRTDEVRNRAVPFIVAQRDGAA